MHWSLCIKQSRSKNLNNAIRPAVELDAHFKTEKRIDLHIIEDDEGAQPQTTQLIDLLMAMQIN